MTAVQTPTGADYARFVERSRQISAIDLRAYKPTQMERRLRALMLRKNIGGFDLLAEQISRDTALRHEFERYVTINVTQFYRDADRFAMLERELKQAFTPQRPLSAWSAGCSNGSEPYTLAMILATIMPGVQHRIQATDIDEESLLKARAAKGYTADELATLPKNYCNAYLIPDRRTGTFEIAPQIKAMVQFARHDLIKDHYRRGYDLILCRNVVIYFCDETKHAIFRGFYSSLNPGGLLFIGATELLSGAREIGFEQRGHGLYCRPAS